MGIIRLKNIRVYAYHGCLFEESQIGSDYLINIELNTDLFKSTISDELSDTVDYVQINTIVKEEMAIKSKLLEHVAQRIINRIFKEHPIVTKVKVGVSKLNPPIGGDVEAVILEIDASRD